MKTAADWQELFFNPESGVDFEQLVGMIREEVLTEAATKVIPATSGDMDKLHAKKNKAEIKNIF